MATTSREQRRLGILICGHPPEELLPEFGRFDNHFINLLGADAFDYHSFAVVDNEFPESIRDADAWLLTGSKYGAYEDHPWIPPLEAFVREIYEAKLPLVGICFGHQLIAQALGGKVVKHQDGWIAGNESYQLSAETGLSTASVNAWHQDQVVELPPGARVIGSSDTCEFAALAYGDHAVTLQPHPEFSNDFIGGLLDTRGKTLPADVQNQVKEGLHKPIGTAKIADWLRTVLNGETA